jgi:cobalamin biosynthetic protein CobC
MGLVGCGSALLWQMPIPQPRSAPRSVLGRYRGPAVEIGARALADRAWLEAAKQRLAQDVARLDQILREAGMRVLGGTMLFRLVECGDAFALFRRLGAAGILVWSFDYRHTWLRFGIPGSKDEWLRLAGTLA